MGWLCLQDVTEENAELALGMKANKGLLPAAATPTGHPKASPTVPKTIHECMFGLRHCIMLTAWHVQLVSQICSALSSAFNSACLPEACLLHC